MVTPNRERSNADDFDHYRRYLQFLARTHLSGRYYNRVDPSDIVQQALLKAYQKRSQFRGTTKEERMSWLRSILLRTLQHAIRSLHAQRRDVKREVPRLHDMEQSSIRLSTFLVSNTPEPSQQMSDRETIVAIAEAIVSAGPAARRDPAQALAAVFLQADC